MGTYLWCKVNCCTLKDVLCQHGGVQGKHY